MPSFSSSKTLLFAGFAGLAVCSPITRRSVTGDNLAAAFETLQGWYDESTGAWSSGDGGTGWWQSANCLTVIANAALLSPDNGIKDKAIPIFENTLSKAPAYNQQLIEDGRLELVKGMAGHVIPPIHGRARRDKDDVGFLNGFYDDEGWWALAWIAAYDVTSDQQYLSEAKTIFADMKVVFGQTNCTNSGGVGGIWWDKEHTYVNAIANELFLSVAAHLANRAEGDEKASYLATAQQQWAWFQGSGMINSDKTINDGLDQATCQNNGKTVWSYNQGVILGALAELSKAAGDNAYLGTAQDIARAAIKNLTVNGILHETCEPNDCGKDAGQFKGVFARGLQRLWQADQLADWRDSLNTNTNSIWANDRNTATNQLSLQWAGPFITPANASTHSSAMDALVGSLAT